MSSALGICVNLLLIRFQQKAPTHPLFTMIKVSRIYLTDNSVKFQNPTVVPPLPIICMESSVSCMEQDDSGVGMQLWTFQISMTFQALVYSPAVLLAAKQWRGTQAAAVSRARVLSRRYPKAAPELLLLQICARSSRCFVQQSFGTNVTPGSAVAVKSCATRLVSSPFASQ